MAWQRLSVRTGKRQPSAPYDGVPPHLVQPLVSWVQKFFVDQYNTLGNTALLQYLGLIHEVAVTPDGDERHLYTEILRQCAQDADFCLDMIDSMLKFGQMPSGSIDDLDAILSLGGSIWQVSPDHKSLTERLDGTVIGQFALTTTPSDTASTELAEAWVKSYGRNPNASDAWDHAIKAVETILIPIVCPTKDKPTLGDVVGCLKAQPGQWKLLLATNGTHGAVETLEAMLRLMWPNPDRHGGIARRTPTLGEAQAVVQLAVTIVQWGRTGVLTKI